MLKTKPKKIENLLEVIRDCIWTGRYRDTMHAVQRKNERKIILPEIIYVLNNDRHYEETKNRKRINL